MKKELSILNIKIKNVLVGIAEIEYDESKLLRRTIEDAINKAGFKVVK